MYIQLKARNLTNIQVEKGGGTALDWRQSQRYGLIDTDKYQLAHVRDR